MIVGCSKPELGKWWQSRWRRCLQEMFIIWWLIKWQSSYIAVEIEKNTKRKIFVSKKMKRYKLKFFLLLFSITQFWLRTIVIHKNGNKFNLGFLRLHSLPSFSGRVLNWNWNLSLCHFFLGFNLIFISFICFTMHVVKAILEAFFISFHFSFVAVEKRN